MFLTKDLITDCFLIYTASFCDYFKKHSKNFMNGRPILRFPFQLKSSYIILNQEDFLLSLKINQKLIKDQLHCVLVIEKFGLPDEWKNQGIFTAYLQKLPELLQDSPLIGIKLQSILNPIVTQVAQKAGYEPERPWEEMCQDYIFLF